MKGAVVERLLGKFPKGTSPNGGIAYLDRDGVINIGSPNYINTPEELVLLDGAAHSIARLKRAGFLVCIVTNQSAITRGLWDAKQLNEIHNRLQTMLLDVDADATIDLIVTCPHRQIDRCNCRKPMPGMLFLGHEVLRNNLAIDDGLNSDVQIADDVCSINWWKSKPEPMNELDFIVGDRNSDLGAGWARGIRLFKVKANIGLIQVIERVLNPYDQGDDFQPVR